MQVKESLFELINSEFLRVLLHTGDERKVTIKRVFCLWSPGFRTSSRRYDQFAIKSSIQPGDFSSQVTDSEGWGRGCELSVSEQHSTESSMYVRQLRLVGEKPPKRQGPQESTYVLHCSLATHTQTGSSASISIKLRNTRQRNYEFDSTHGQDIIYCWYGAHKASHIIGN